MTDALAGDRADSQAVSFESAGAWTLRNVVPGLLYPLLFVGLCALATAGQAVRDDAGLVPWGIRWGGAAVWLLMAASLVALSPRTPAAATLVHDAAGLVVRWGRWDRRDQRVPWRTLGLAWVTPAGAKWFAHALAGTRLLSVETTRRDEAEAIVCEIERRRPGALRLPLRRVPDAWPWARFVGWLPLVALLLRARASFGRDGVLLQCLFGRRFLSYASLRDAYCGLDGVSLELRGGDPILLHPAPPGGARRLERDQAVATRVAEGIQSVGANATRAEQLGHHGRRLRDWTRAVRATSASGYRSSSVEPRTALAVLEDPSAPPDQRVGAALAIGPLAEPGIRQRARIAVDACVEPRLHPALETALDEAPDEQTIERALRASSPQHEAAHRAKA